MQNQKNLGCLIYGVLEHHLDHLAPLAEVLGVPLIVTEDSIAAPAKKYYPFVETVYWDYACVAHNVVEQFDVIICSFPRLLFEEIFFFAQSFAQRRVHTIWCPHGNSDKGHHSHHMESLEHEQVALVYGKRMVEFLIQKKVFHRITRVITMGNLRFEAFGRHKNFYTGLVDKEVRHKLPPSPCTLFYAPTWQDKEENSSFYSAIEALIRNLPKAYNLLVKLHPNSLIKDALKIEQMIDQHAGQGNILFLKEFPPIYPLLDFIDVYIGDMSSIGYDVLAFSKPMYFLNHKNVDVATDPASYLFRCGVVVPKEKIESFYDILDATLRNDTKNFAHVRKEVYTHTFGTSKGLKKEMRTALAVFKEEKLLIY